MMEEKGFLYSTALINIENCNKCGLCAEAAPAVIVVDNDNYPYWLYGYSQGGLRFWQNFSAEFIDDVNEAIASCTCECISLTDTL